MQVGSALRLVVREESKSFDGPDDAVATMARTRVTAEFDPGFYLASYADIAGAGVDPLDHYLSRGHKEGRRPCAWFDPDYYLTAYPRAALHVLGPFAHYLCRGRSEGLLPSADFTDYANPRVKLFVKWLFSRYVDRRFYQPAIAAGGAAPSALEALFNDRALLRGSPLPVLDAVRYAAGVSSEVSAVWHLFHVYIVNELMCGDTQLAAYERFKTVVAPSNPAYRNLRRVIEPYFYYEFNGVSPAEVPDPISHYLGGGWIDDLDPARGFSTSFYLEQYPDVASSGVNPFAHYLRDGRKEGRLGVQPPLTKGSAAAELGLLEYLLARRGDPTVRSEEPELRPDVTVVCPIHGALRQVKALLASFERTLAPGQPIVLVDDFSQDAALTRHLRRWCAGREGARLIELRSNLGFSGACNSALRSAQGHAVVVNSDVQVPPGWLGRLLKPIDDDPLIASVTPFSNTSSTTGFPDLPNESPIYLGMTVEELDAVAARLPGEPIELPTGTGFCMAINALALQTIGGFRDDIFGRGYYEDTDWCQRAASEGFRNVQAPNLFVYHEPGSSSFTEASRVQLSEHNRTEFGRRHPRYGGLARHFLRNDPYSAYRRVLKVGAWLEAASQAGLYLQHGWGGGVSSAVEASTKSLLATGGCAIEVMATGADLFSLVFGYGDERVEFTGVSSASLGSLLRAAAPGSVELHAGHSLTDPPVAIADILNAVGPDANVRLFVHDFLLVCPSQHLLDWRGRYCGVPTAGHCGTCLPRNHYASAFALSIDDWRRKWSRVLSRVTEVVVFDESALPILSAAYPVGLPPVRVEPHLTPPPSAKPQYRPRRTLSHLGFVGSMWRHKGSALVRSICSYMEQELPEVALTLVGEWMDGAAPNNLTVTGRYEPDGLQDILDDLDIDAVVFPSVCPETFSFTLSELFAMRVPCVGLDIGAQGARLRAYDRGAVASSEPWVIAQEVERLLERCAGQIEASAC